MEPQLFLQQGPSAARAREKSKDPHAPPLTTLPSTWCGGGDGAFFWSLCLCACVIVLQVLVRSVAQAGRRPNLDTWKDQVLTPLV